MMTRFSKQKLAEVQEKKAKGGTVSGLLSKKKASDFVKKDATKTPPPAKCPASPTPSLEMIASGGEEIWKRKKSGGKSFLPTFWDDADATALKAHESFDGEVIQRGDVVSHSEACVGKSCRPLLLENYAT